MSDQPTPILCHECRHDIDWHSSDWSDSYGICDGDDGVCPCDERASTIARALLTAEPTEAEVESVAAALYDEISYNRVAEWGDVRDDQTGENFRELATTALRAAREARR